MIFWAIVLPVSFLSRFLRVIGAVFILSIIPFYHTALYEKDKVRKLRV
jgi:hypothetical protein